MTTKRIAQLQRRLYTQFPLIGSWLRRRAAKRLARDGSPEAVRMLAEAVTRSGDVRVCHIALETLWHITAQPAVDASCAVWVATRHAELADILTERQWVASAPIAIRVLTALKVQRRELITALGPEVVSLLLAACYDDDSTVAPQARLAVGELASPDAREALAEMLCAQWAETRAPQLESLMVQGRYVAQQPLAIRVLSALKTAQPHLLTGLGAEVIGPLLQACEDSDVHVREQACLTLQRLENVDAREALCRLLIDRDHAIAHEAAVQGQYAPRDEYQRALFFFLTEQWERYDVLDFNRRLLSSLYASADPPLRQRITEKLRLAGRTDFLTILVGSDTRSRAADMAPDETAFLVHILAANKEWPRLWGLVFTVSLAWSMRIVQILAQSPWKPEPGDERATFEALIMHASPEVMVTHDDLRRAVPPAVQRARARVAGRVNDVAFSPVRPVIAVGTGQRKLVLWNFQHAQREQVLDAFDHSIGRVAFTHGDILLCAERSHTAAACTIHAWRDGQRWRLAQLGSAVTALAPLGDTQVLITERDHTVSVWDVQAGRRVRKHSFDFWARAACVSADGQHAALLHDGVTLVALPQLQILARTGWSWHGVARCAAFAPAGEALLVGKFSGEVVVCHRSGQSLHTNKHSLVTHQGQVQTVAVLPSRVVVITAGSEGWVQFTAWADRSPVGHVEVPGQRLTSLHISPDGAFMAVGDSDASMSLWDLRVLDVPQLLDLPFAHMVPMHLAAISTLLSYGELPLPVRHAVRFIEGVLRHRFRYDIEIDELPTIRAGEFDIEIEA